jgi:hypothetical protein
MGGHFVWGFSGIGISRPHSGKPRGGVRGRFWGKTARRHRNQFSNRSLLSNLNGNNKPTRDLIRMREIIGCGDFWLLFRDYERLHEANWQKEPWVLMVGPKLFTRSDNLTSD